MRHTKIQILDTTHKFSYNDKVICAKPIALI
jgi:hypothetical protein